MFSCVSLEQPVPRDHPLRPMCEIVGEGFRGPSPPFEGPYPDARPEVTGQVAQNTPGRASRLRGRRGWIAGLGV